MFGFLIVALAVPSTPVFVGGAFLPLFGRHTPTTHPHTHPFLEVSMLHVRRRDQARRPLASTLREYAEVLRDHDPPSHTPKNSTVDCMRLDYQQVK